MPPSDRWDLAAVPPPWDAGRRSIHAHVAATPEADLPDEPDDGGIRWIAGGEDGAAGHHGGSGGKPDRARLVDRALRVVLEDATADKVEKLYVQLVTDRALDYVDRLFDLLGAEPALDRARLTELAAWLATAAPDREPVKLGIALLGFAGAAAHADLIATLGRHEELTLFAAVALTNLGAEPLLFELAGHVHGWGRIQVVERLARTDDPRIKAWLVREGYRNDIMIEYLAHTCAVAGDLRGELAAATVDDALLAGAGRILRALIAGGPAEDLDDYADGAVVTERYLHHLGAAPRELAQLLAADAIGGFVDEERDWTERARRGWTLELRDRVRSRVRAIKALPHWHDEIAAGLAADDPAVHWRAVQAARAIGLDTWAHHLERIVSGKGDDWYQVMQTDDVARIDRVVALAEERLPLDQIASGPAAELGLGLAWKPHGHLDFVLQDLGRFPGKGWPLIRAGLRSPVVRNRNMALRALAGWGRPRWPADAEAVLEQAVRDEIDDRVRARIAAVLAGTSLDED